jgi:hypothetical protein
MIDAQLELTIRAGERREAISTARYIDDVTGMAVAQRLAQHGNLEAKAALPDISTGPNRFKQRTSTHYLPGEPKQVGEDIEGSTSDMLQRAFTVSFTSMLSRTALEYGQAPQFKWYSGHIGHSTP